MPNEVVDYVQSLASYNKLVVGITFGWMNKTEIVYETQNVPV